jgi:hypothetical protein
VRAVLLGVVFGLFAEADVRVDDVGGDFGRDDGAALSGEGDVRAVVVWGQVFFGFFLVGEGKRWFTALGMGRAARTRGPGACCTCGRR